MLYPPSLSEVIIIIIILIDIICNFLFCESNIKTN